MKKLIESWLPSIVWAALIFTLSSHSVATVTQIYWKDFVVKKTAHVVEYAIFGLLLFRSLRLSGVEKMRASFWAVAIAIIYAASDEFHQSFVSGRQPRVWDVGFDTIGASLGQFGLWKLLPKAPKKLQTLAQRLQLI